MNYISVSNMAKKWGLSERTVRNYCAQGKIEGAYLVGKTWSIPEMAERPDRINKRKSPPRTLLEVLKAEKAEKISGGIYHKVQIEFTYNSNHIEGSKLTHDQTRHIFDTNTIGLENKSLNVDDIVETANHFRCIDIIIDQTSNVLSEKLIKQLHGVLKNGTTDSRRDWFVVGDYKKLPNEVGEKETTPPELVQSEMKKLITHYNSSKNKKLKDLIDFHVKFELIHPFADGNGRVGRLILFKECLRYSIVPFIINEDLKMFYYRGIQEWKKEKGYLMDTCLTVQDQFKKYLDYFRITY